MAVLSKGGWSQLPISQILPFFAAMRLATIFCCRWIALLLTVGLCLAQQTSQPLPDFVSPVRGVMQLTGTFGELRGNHFHGGLDIRGAVGRPIYAIGDGYISRMRTGISGYGQALYLTHPSGHTSVYGHLDRFRDDLMGHLRELQYAREHFLIDETFGPERFPIRKGELIGYLGKRGYVSGPHLHFEIRDTESERNLNPMNFGITVADTRRPEIRMLRVYELDERGNVLAGRDLRVRGARGQYGTVEDTIWVDQPQIAFGLKAYDQQNGRPNWNGIYALELAAADSMRFAFRMDHFAGAQTRYLNAHLDYGEQQLHDSWFHRCFRLQGNELDIYQTDAQQGRLQLHPGEALPLDFTVGDHRGNESHLRAVVKRRAGAPVLPQRPPYTYFLPHTEANIIDNGSLRAHFPEGAFYEDVYLHYELVVEDSDGLYAPVHSLHRAAVPVHRYFDLQIRPNAIPEHLRDKAVIAYCEDGAEPLSYGGEWVEGRLRAPVRSFGNYTIMIDTVPPLVEPYRFQRDMRGWEAFSFKITDNFPTAGKAHSLRYRAEVDGQWILMEYDLRTDRLFHTFDGRIPRGKHQLRLRVQDDRGNERLVEREFVR
jgi:murein DD-endopeptidase MepM/ murein hydrolase activator NlpD